MSKSLYKKVGIATLITTASIFLSRVTGLLREMALAYIGGATGDVDAYQIAFVIPEILNHIGAAGFLSVTFIPIFTEYLVKKDEAEGWRIFSLICNVFGAIVLLFIVVSFIFAEDLIGLIVPGVHDPAILAKGGADDKDNHSRSVFLLYRFSFYGCPVCEGKIRDPGVSPDCL